MKSKKVAVGLVGCGGVAHMHARALKRIKQAEIKAVVDIDERKARLFAEKYKIKRYYKSLTTMLEKEDIQAVSILTPPQSHAELAIEAMTAGKHVLVEKPMCITLKEAETMVSVSERNNVKLFPIEQVVFTPVVQRAMKLIKSGKVGEINSIHVYMSVATLLSHFSRGNLPKWIYSLPGGIYGELIPHALYTSLILLGEHVKEIHVSYLKEEREELKNVCPFKELRIFLETKNRIGFIIMTARDVSKHEVQRITIDCEKAKILIDLPISTVLVRNYHGNRVLQILQYPLGLLHNFLENLFDLVTIRLYSGVSWKIANELFIESIIENKQLPFNGHEGKEWVRVTELIWQKCLPNYSV